MSPSLSFALFVDLDDSDSSPLAAQVTPSWLALVAADVTLQLHTDVGMYWPDAEGAIVRAAKGATDIAAGEIAFAIVSKLANAPGAEAYHDVGGNAVPIAFLALDTCSTLDDVSVGISHECIETVGDPECNLFADDGKGSSWAYELCDAVQGSTYAGTHVRLSDFVLPPFFAPSASSGPYHFLAAHQADVDLPGPFATQQGGYQITRPQGAGETQVFGAQTKLAKAAAALSRMHRRGVRLPRPNRINAVVGPRT